MTILFNVALQKGSWIELLTKKNLQANCDPFPTEFFVFSTPFINLPIVNLWWINSAIPTRSMHKRHPPGFSASLALKFWSFWSIQPWKKAADDSRWWKNGVITCYNPYKWPYIWVTGVITLLMELIFLMKKVGNHQVIWINISQLQRCSPMIVSINIMSYFSESPSSQSHVFSCETWSSWLVKETRLNVLVPVTSHILRGILFTPIKQHRDRLTQQNPCFSRTRAGKTKKHNECVWEWYQV